jgi:capsular polysaccharide export protein
MRTYSPFALVKPDLRNITHGYRSATSLIGRSEALWIDRWVGRLALTLAHACGAKIIASWPGPIWSKTRFGEPLLSWFVAPIVHAGPNAFADAINEALVGDGSAGSSPDVARLMQRVLRAQACSTRAKALKCPPALLEPRFKTRVLLIDEWASSRSLEATSPRHRSREFEKMVRVARESHPNAEFWLCRSEDQGSGCWLSAIVHELPPRIQHASHDDSLCAILPQVDHVYTVGASEGMHALIAGTRVHVFGLPYYAGWGLTHDDHAFARRTARPSLAALFDVVFLRFARYLNPATHLPGTLNDLLDSIELQQTVQQRFADLQHVVGVRFQWWKRPFATPFLNAGAGSLRWTKVPASLGTNECAAIWGARSTEGLPPHIPHVRIEDGFFHSTGLGSDMIAPCSQVIDRRSLYFDSRQASDLTVLLNETDFSDAELARASELREMVVQLGITKYNLGRRRPSWTAPPGRQVILVPGQVADDASIRLGTRTIATADALLREVRQRRPHAFVIYKPHPDVLSGNRVGLVNAQSLADVVDTEADLLSLIDAAHEVHTLSSLAGFDALLRGKAVFTYGLPFYAGWGLTHDALAPVPWRERALTLDMLTAGVLLHYPIYWDWRLRLFTTPEAIVQQLAPRASRPLGSMRGRFARPCLKAARWSRNVLHHVAWIGKHWLDA